MKKIRLPLAAFVIAIVSAFAVKAAHQPPTNIKWWVCVGDITNPYDYFYGTPAGCSYIGTRFCCLKAYEDPLDRGYPQFTRAMMNDLAAISSGTNPTANSSDAIRFKP